MFTVFFIDGLTTLVRSIYDQDASTATSTHIKAEETPLMNPVPPNTPKARQSGKHPAGQAAIGQRTRLLTDVDKLIDMHTTVVF